MTQEHEKAGDSRGGEATKRGVRVTCAKCRHTKQPVGRCAPLGAYYCNPSDCDGHGLPPHVGSLWPGETDADFGFPCGDAGTEPIDHPNTDERHHD